MRSLLTAILLVATSVAAGPIYRSFDKDGNVIYSDKPAPGAKAVEVAPNTTTYSPPPLPNFSSKPSASQETVEQPAADLSYESFALLTPKNDEAVRANAGNVGVEFDVRPGLQPGHRIRVLLDGTAAAEITEAAGTLENVDRGTHTLSAELLDADGGVLARTPAVTFHLLRVSIL